MHVFQGEWTIFTELWKNVPFFFNILRKFLLVQVNILKPLKCSSFLPSVCLDSKYSSDHTIMDIQFSPPILVAYKYPIVSWFWNWIGLCPITSRLFNEYSISFILSGLERDVA